MDHLTVCAIMTVHDNGQATVLTYDLEHVTAETVAEVQRLLGTPAVEQLLEADELAAHFAAPDGVVLHRE